MTGLTAEPLMSEYSIADDLDPDGDMPADADPLATYLTYLADVRGGDVGDMGFTIDDFKRYIVGLRTRSHRKP
jgi:hypothetical protein